MMPAGLDGDLPVAGAGAGRAAGVAAAGAAVSVAGAAGLAGATAVDTIKALREKG